MINIFNEYFIEINNIDYISINWNNNANDRDYIEIDILYNSGKTKYIKFNIFTLAKLHFDDSKYKEFISFNDDMKYEKYRQELIEYGNNQIIFLKNSLGN